jgi:hypothetical protein
MTLSSKPEIRSNTTKLVSNMDSLLPLGSNKILSWLVYRLAYNGDIAAGQLAVFQGASDEHI